MNKVESASSAINRLQYLCETIPALLSEMEDAEFSRKVSPDKWSKKEIIGHLIDSATNNHHRIARAQFEMTPFIKYNQNEWNKFNYYQQMDSKQIIDFWTVYNLQIVGLSRMLQTEMLNRTINAGGDTDLTLEYVITDYVRHLEHHLRQVVNYQ